MFNFVKRMLLRFTFVERKKRYILKMLETCFKKKYLTKWEDTFVKSLKRKSLLSEKQFLKLEEIYLKKDLSMNYQYDACSFGELEKDSRYNYQHDVAYDDIHDFS